LCFISAYSTLLAVGAFSPIRIQYHLPFYNIILFYRRFERNEIFRWCKWLRGLRRGSAAACLLILWVRIPPAMDVFLLYVLFVVTKRSQRKADHWSGGALPTVVFRCMWSRNLKNEMSVTPVGPQRHRKMMWIYVTKCKKLKYLWKFLKQTV
jgi:hypothetical protein